MAKKKVPTPRPDPREALRPQQQMNSVNQGTPMDVRDHPAHNKPDATEHYDGTALGDAFTALGPKASYQVETSQMGQAVDISETVPRRAE